MSRDVYVAVPRYCKKRANAHPEDTIANTEIQDEGGELDEDLQDIEKLTMVVSWIDDTARVKYILIKPSPENSEVAVVIYKQLMRRFIR